LRDGPVHPTARSLGFRNGVVQNIDAVLSPKVPRWADLGRADSNGYLDFPIAPSVPSVLSVVGFALQLLLNYEHPNGCFGPKFPHGAAMLSRRTFTFAFRTLIATSLFAVVAAAPALCAQQTSSDDHLVTSAQLQQQAQTASAARQANIDNLTHFLSTSTAEKAMRDSKIDPTQVKTAIPTLSDQELASLSQRATRAQHDFAAGSISNQTLLIIILVLVAVILIAVIR